MAKRLRVEVTIISAQDLKNVESGCFSGKMSPFVEAWTTSSPARKFTLRARKGGQHPAFHTTLAFLCGEDSIMKGLESLTIRLWHTSFIKKSLLGTVTVPLGSEYLSDAPKAVASDVVLPLGEKQGVLNCSVKICDALTPYVPPTSAQSVGVAAGVCGGCEW